VWCFNYAQEQHSKPVHILLTAPYFAGFQPLMYLLCQKKKQNNILKIQAFLLKTISSNYYFRQHSKTVIKGQ